MGWFATGSQRQLERVLFSDKSYKVVEICKAWRLESDSECQTHTRGDITFLPRGVLDLPDSKHLCGWRDEFDALRNTGVVGHLHRDLVDAVDLVLDEVHGCRFHSERCQLLHLLNLSVLFNRLHIINQTCQNSYIIQTMSRI